MQQPAQFAQTVAYRLQSHGAPVAAEMLALYLQQPVRPSPAEAHRPYWFIGRAAVRPGDAGDGYRPVAAGGALGTAGHDAGGSGADGAVASQHLGWDAQQLLLGLIAISDETPAEPG